MKKYNLFKKFIVFTILFSLISVSSSCSVSKKQSLTISVAASLKNVMEDIQKSYNINNKNIELSFNYGGSGSLEQQIEQGAPADVFISAGESQMNNLDKKSLLLSGSRQDLLINHLDLIAPLNSKLTNIDNLKSDSVKKIAIGDPTTVPAGKYATEVLDYYGLKNNVAGKLIQGSDVTQVLSWVLSGNADAGFVYSTDALSTNKVKVITTLPEASHKPILYPVAIIKTTKNKDASKLFVKFLSSEDAKNIFKKYGFEVK